VEEPIPIILILQLAIHKGFVGPPKSKVLGTYFIGLKLPLDIIRKIQEASAFNFDCIWANSQILNKGVGAARNHRY
jgi:hypothetical protein